MFVFTGRAGRTSTPETRRQRSSRENMSRQKSCETYWRFWMSSLPCVMILKSPQSHLLIKVTTESILDVVLYIVTHRWIRIGVDITGINALYDRGLKRWNSVSNSEIVPSSMASNCLYCTEWVQRFCEFQPKDKMYSRFGDDAMAFITILTEVLSTL
jgi:hypothetical protein